MRYPKLTILLGTFVAAYFLHEVRVFDQFIQLFGGHGYWTMLVAGLTYSFGFTAAFGTALIVELSPSVDPVLGAIVGGLGAAFTDIGIFSLVRSSMFSDEIGQLKASRIVLRIRESLRNSIPSKRMRHVLLWISAGIIIASPLPDEFGVTLVSAISPLRLRWFPLLCLVLNTLGILIVLSGTKMMMG
ncbi:MAG: hypothetical protein Q7S29_04470 [Candidatus Peribacter sp.]|nr:hypothetical protein [Candidatus Peribacter sp.]